jgi:hypothetical protein
VPRLRTVICDVALFHQDADNSDDAGQVIAHDALRRCRDGNGTQIRAPFTERTGDIRRTGVYIGVAQVAVTSRSSNDRRGSVRPSVKTTDSPSILKNSVHR